MTSVENVVHNSGGELIIEVSGYEREAPESLSDANWVNAQVCLRKDNFAGAAAVSLTTQDLLCLHTAVATLASDGGGEARFEAVEGSLSVAILLRPHGAGELRAVLNDPLNLGVSLRVRFEIDRTDVEGLLRTLAATVRRFPPKNA
jgi:hypothetical protein